MDALQGYGSSSESEDEPIQQPVASTGSQSQQEQQGAKPGQARPSAGVGAVPAQQQRPAGRAGGIQLPSAADLFFTPRLSREYNDVGCWIVGCWRCGSLSATLYV